MLDFCSKIYVAGHSGLVGCYLTEQLKQCGYTNIVTKSSQELDLTDLTSAERFFDEERPEYVFLVAALKGGVAEYSKSPVEYFTINMSIEMNVMYCAKKYGVNKLVFVAASCVYPETVNKVMSEDCFMSGWVQKATEPYALAKAAGIRLCEYYNTEYGTNYVAALPANLYGITDEKHFDQSTVMLALISRFKQAVTNGFHEVVVWGDGTVKREFLHAQDCADALVKVMESEISEGWINIGAGEMITIRQLVDMIVDITGYRGRVIYDSDMHGGSKRSVLNVSKLKALGWKQKVTLREGIKELADSIRV